MKKRGQLSIFFVIGILLILFVFIVNQTNNDPDVYSFLDNPEAEFRNYVEACLTQIGTISLRTVMAQGGYYHPTNRSTHFFGMDVAYFWHNNQNRMPSLFEIENQVALGVQDLVGLCFNDFSDFENQGFQVHLDTELLTLLPQIGNDLGIAEHVHVQIVPERAILLLIFPVTLDKGSVQYRYDSFAARIPTRFDEMFDVAQQMMLIQELYPRSIPSFFLAEQASEKDFGLELYHFNQSAAAISFVFSDSKVDEESVFTFINQYDWAHDNSSLE